MKTLLVSLVSDQTIPNVRLITELKNEDSNHLFITTLGMKKKGTNEWIKKAAEIDELNISELTVNQFSFDDIEEKLDSYDFEKYDKIIVNLTGGTKIMTLAAFDFFKELGADIYYLTGNKDEYIKLSPGRKKKSYILTSKVSLKQYLYAYGFELKHTSSSNISVIQTEAIFKSYIDGVFYKYINILEQLRLLRGKSLSSLNLITDLDEFLNDIKYKPLKEGLLNKYEIKYLTGEWFEEYVANQLKVELKLSDNEIEVGLVISKTNKNGVSIPNEMDVLFIYENNLYTIECKTSIINRIVNSKGEYENINILKDTIFKSDSLKQGFGLFVNTSIFVLDELENSLNLERAELSRIKIIDKKQLVNAESFSKLIIAKN